MFRRLWAVGGTRIQTITGAASAPAGSDSSRGNLENRHSRPDTGLEKDSRKNGGA
jgi:hypothetical protein